MIGERRAPKDATNAAAAAARRCETLSARHFFFSRQGGVSTGVYDGLQCGFGAEDDPAAVQENRARAAGALGVDPGALVTVHQIHSAEVIVLPTEGPLPRWDPTAAPKADALVSRRSDVALGVLSADCAPCLFEDSQAGVVGAAHAGWKGALGGVLEATVVAMEGLGARRDRIRLGIGPTIGPRAYQVGPEYEARFLDADPANRRFFGHPDAEGRVMFDLPAYLIARARRIGLQDAVWIGVCTYADEAGCFSYRRATHRKEGDYGRLLSAIRAPAVARPSPGADP